MHVTVFFIDFFVDDVCDMLALVSVRHCFKSLVSALITKFSSQRGLGIICFLFIPTLTGTFVILAEHRYLQMLSDIGIASFPLLLFKSK